MPSIGLIAILEPGGRRSGYLAQAQAPRLRLLLPQGLVVGSAPSSRAGDVLILRAICSAKLAPQTLLIIGGADHGVIKLNEWALGQLKGPKALEIVPGASHLFPEPGALEVVIAHAGRWFAHHLTAPPGAM